MAESLAEQLSVSKEPQVESSLESHTKSNESNDSNEHRILQKHYHDIFSARFSPIDLVNKLASERIISEGVIEEVQYAKSVKNGKMKILRAVRYRIHGDKLVFGKFLTILIGFKELRAVATKMLREYQSEIKIDLQKQQHYDEKQGMVFECE